MIDIDYTISRVNDSFCRLSELDKDDVIKQKCFNVINHSHCNTPDCYLARVLHGKVTYRNKSTIKVKSGRSIICMATYKSHSEREWVL